MSDASKEENMLMSVFCMDLFALRTNDECDPTHTVKWHSREKHAWRPPSSHNKRREYHSPLDRLLLSIATSSDSSGRLVVYSCINPPGKPESSSWLRRHHRRSNHWLIHSPSSGVIAPSMDRRSSCRDLSKKTNNKKISDRSVSFPWLSIPS